MKKMNLDPIDAVLPLLPGGIAALLLKKTGEIIRDAVAENSNKSIEKISEETSRQEMITQQLIDNARVEQEMAISMRIAMSEVVHIEEYYDLSGEGKLGLSVSESSGTGGTSSDTVTLGASGSGKKISKRVYKFIGWRGDTINNKDEHQQNEELDTKDEHQQNEESPETK
jgi:hypothetical protein